MTRAARFAPLSPAASTKPDARGTTIDPISIYRHGAGGLAGHDREDGLGLEGRQSLDLAHNLADLLRAVSLGQIRQNFGGHLYVIHSPDVIPHL